MSQTIPRQDPEVAVLYERVSNLLDDYEYLRDRVEQVVELLPLLRAEISRHDAKTERMFRALSAQSDAIGVHSTRIAQHQQVIKMVGAVLLACSGVIGWGWTNIQTFQQTDAVADRRLSLLEYRIDNGTQRPGGPPPR